MTTQTFHMLLVEETVRQCGHQERKGVLSMSSLLEKDEVIIDRFRNGHDVDTLTKLKFYHGSHAEEGMRTRLIALFEQTGKLECGTTLVAYDGRLTGHVDFIIDGIVVEYKTVPTVEILDRMREQNNLPRRVFYQVQAYLLWGKFPKAFVVYESRAGGFPWVIEVLPDGNIRAELRAKADRLITALFP